MGTGSSPMVPESFRYLDSTWLSSLIDFLGFLIAGMEMESSSFMEKKRCIITTLEGGIIVLHEKGRLH